MTGSPRQLGNGEFEVEFPIRWEDLNSAQKALVTSLDEGSTSIQLKVVYEIGSKHFEAYYLGDQSLLKKIHFGQDGELQ